MSDYYENLERWQELSATIKKLKGEERALREALFKGTFPDPEEGTNKHELPDGRIVKGVFKINRRVIEDEITSVPKALREKVFKVKHSLQTRAYRDLTDNQKQIVDAVLKISPGLPSLDVVEPEPSKEKVAP